MSNSSALYLSDMWITECDAKVVSVSSLPDGGATIILDRTVFYPQGGGQPYDRGFITGVDRRFEVLEVRGEGDNILHKGRFHSAPLQVGDNVHCHIDEERRALMSRLHSAGHIIDWSLERLGVKLKQVKAYHFPDGPYVEYEGSNELASLRLGLTEELKKEIEAMCAEIVKEAHETRILFMPKSEARQKYSYVPDFLPEDKPVRIVAFGETFGVSCGGTHVKNTGECGVMSVRKIKISNNHVKIAYAVK